MLELRQVGLNAVMQTCLRGVTVSMALDIGTRLPLKNNKDSTLVAWMVSSISLSQVEVRVELRDWYVAESIRLRTLDEMSCFRGRWDGMGKAIPAIVAVEEKVARVARTVVLVLTRVTCGCVTGVVQCQSAL